MGLTPLECNLHKYDLVVIFQIMQMIEAVNFGTKRPLRQSGPTSGEDGINESTNRKIGSRTVQKTVKLKIKWME